MKLNSDESMDGLIYLWLSMERAAFFAGNCLSLVSACGGCQIAVVSHFSTINHFSALQIKVFSVLGKSMMMLLLSVTSFLPGPV